ncbi:MAG TPA: PQQ-binding-like beta-propeller repeat protein [Candidatus Limnocylindrales bacterium]|jgi:outer membrane protein assembly factor BamB|nr:PQQ-binding-like beta-propeller repeat protein [Candidatus Limnocylindrales bacterium]
MKPERTILLVILAVSRCSVAAERGGEPWWPQFRGPNSSGLGAGKPPVQFGPGQNLGWKTAVGSGTSSPIIWAERVFVTEFDPASRKLATLSIDRRTGNLLWRRAVVAEQVEEVHELSSPAAATPATDGERVYVYFGSYGLLCYDLDGKLEWERRLPLPENPYGATASPILVGDLLIFNHQGKDAYLLALNRRDGRTVWRTDRSKFQFGWSTPVHWRHDASDEVLVLGGDFEPNQRLMAYDLATGAERWWVAGLPPCGKSTPAIGGGLVFLAAPDIILNQSAEKRNPDKAAQFYAKNGNRLMAVRPGSTGEVPQANIAWSDRKGVPGVASPLYYDGRLYTFKDGGLVFCRAAATGELLFNERLGTLGYYYSSPVAADHRIYIASAEGVITVIDAGAKLNVLATNKLDGAILATPALAADNIYVRTKSDLYAFGNRP